MELCALLLEYLVLRADTNRKKMALGWEVKYVTTLPILAFGLVGNIVSVAVWSTLVDKVGGARFLMALSVSDSLAIVSGILFSTLSLLGSPCVADPLLYVGDIFYFTSSSITIAIVIQRYLSVAYPFSVSRLCSGFRQGVTIVSLVVLTAVQNIAYGQFAADRYTSCTGGDIDVNALVASYLKLVYAYVAMNFVAPCLLFVFNVLLLRSLRNMATVSLSAYRCFCRSLLFSVRCACAWVHI